MTVDAKISPRRGHPVLGLLVDWTVELFFPKDIVQTIDLR